MRRSTHLMIVCCYYFAKLLGILNFSYDFRTRRAYKNIYVTIYAGLLNVSLYAVIPYIGMTMKLKTRPPGSEELLYNLSVLITFIRIGGALTSVIFNWTKREEFIKLINSYQLFCEQYLQKYRKHEHFMKYMEQGVRIKFLCSLFTDLTVLTGSLQIFRDIFENSNIFILLALALIPSVLNRIMLHYYFILQNVNALLKIINEELEAILKTTTTEGDNKCKGMSNYVNVLASMVIQLQYYVARFNRIYEIQGFCCMLTVYVNNICIIYMTFMTSASDNLWNQLHTFKGFRAILSLAIHYYDLKLFMWSMLDASRLVNRLGKLLKYKQSLLPCGDLKLERSLQNVSLQMAALPLEIDLVGLYVVKKPIIFALFGSAIANAIVLMQYDFKYK